MPVKQFVEEKIQGGRSWLTMATAAASPGWPDLPMDILLEILRLLECTDLMRCAATGTRAYCDLRRRGIAGSRQTPCLIYRPEATGLNAIGMYCLSEKRPYVIPIPDPPISEWHWFGSSDGWLMTADCRSDIILLNPITGRQIALPPAITMEHVKPVMNEEGILQMYEVSFYDARNPSLEHTEPGTYSLEEYHDDYIAVLVHGPYDQLSFAKVGGNTWNWLAVDFFLVDCIYHDGWFYAGRNSCLNLHGPCVVHKTIFPRIQQYNMNQEYIVRAPWGDLLQIYRTMDGIRGEQPDNQVVRTLGFRVYKISLDEQKLVMMTGIGDHALFVGQNASVCLSVKDHPTLMLNHVYFTDDDFETLFCDKSSRRDVGVCNIENYTVTRVVCPELWMYSLPPIWLTPSLIG
uniref:KIB1-4 beta-propeller domain-containing protein n=1 Tax=Leersia perrieri TaxID=77586 RepID=A0A0D9WR11_9ORYZ